MEVIRCCPFLRWLRALALLCLGIAMAQAVQAMDHIVERGWLEDPSGQMTWAEARQQPTQPFEGTLNLGYGQAVVWLRLRLDPDAGQGQVYTSPELLLRVRPVYLDEITVYDPLAPGGVAGVMGDRLHPQLAMTPGFDFLLPLPRGDAPRDIWLRVASISTRQIHVMAVHRGDFDVLEMRQNMLASLYVGLILLMMAWGVINRVMHRDKVLGAFAVMQLTAALFAMSSSGMLRIFWPSGFSAQALDWLGSLFSVLVVTGGLLFHQRFLRDIQPAPWALRLLQALLALSIVNLGLLVLGQVMWALQSNMLILLAASPTCLACVASGRAWAAAPGQVAPPLSRRVLLGFYAFFLGLFLLTVTAGLGWMRSSEGTLYLSQLHSVVSGALLMVMLQYRAFRQEKQRQHTVLALEKASLQAAHERSMREDQEKLLAMLAHEIKTPLATMHLRLDGQAKGGREIREAMREMNAVIDRCLQTLQLGDGQLSADLQRLDLTGLVRSVVPTCSQPERIQLHLPASLPVDSDPQLLFIVLSNLLENACKYARPGTPIHLAAHVLPETGPRKTVRLTVRNEPGQAGWPDPKHVFDKYYRSAQAKRQSGTGLGLYLAHNLMHTLGGTLSYEPDEKAVVFALTLPLPLALPAQAAA